MTYKFTPLLTLLCISLLSAPAFAGKTPRPGSADARVKKLTYYESEVYRLRGHYGFSSVIEFSSKERIETISIGDSEAWQVIKPNRPNILFIKPLEQNAETNMTVITTKRIYTFELSASKARSHTSSDLTFRVKFVYPNETALELANISTVNASSYDPLEGSEAGDWNFDYSYAGSKRLRPKRAFDDGTFTYLQFKDFETMPAIFAVDENGNESLVNYNVQGKYLVVTSMGAQFTLRDGDTATCIFNDNFPKPDTKPIAKTKTPIAAIKEKTVKPKQYASNGIPVPREKPSFGDEDSGNSVLAWLSTFTSSASSGHINQ